MRVALSLLALTLIGSVLFAASQDSPTERDGRPSKKVVPQVGAYYFYWYRHPDQHFTNEDGSDGLFQHFKDPESVDYADPAWHREQLDAMIDAGLDFLLPVYWGIPDKKRPDDFSDKGLAAIVEAARTIRKEGGAPPRIGMFYDTSTLLHSVRGEEADGTLDLRTPGPRKIFGDTILQFFEKVPKSMWFELDGFPVIVLYASFGAPHPKDLLDEVSDRFFVTFKKRPFFVAEASWNVNSHARYRWGAALTGPTGDSIVTTIGPGYNDTKVPGRGTPIRDREGGRFYEWSWQKALLSNPTLVFIETWNEFHEGTGIAPCVEFGDSYIELTRRYVKRLKRHILPDVNRLVRLVHPNPIPRPDRGWFRPRRGQTRVAFDASRAGKDLLGEGIRLISQPDGLVKRETVAGKSVLRSATPPGGVSYLYFGIADEFLYRDLGSTRIVVELASEGGAKVTLHYDGWNKLAPLNGAYSQAPAHQFPRGISERKRLVWTLPDSRFTNRENGAADFRLAIRGAPVTLLRVELERIEKQTARRPSLRVE
ncbi:MAG TPA: hypothetical protein ENK43_02310 [Planctomycetes bacterium]|nr:hypothetical protein [Planctomycetota bacterium]